MSYPSILSCTADWRSTCAVITTTLWPRAASVAASPIDCVAEPLTTGANKLVNIATLIGASPSAGSVGAARKVISAMNYLDDHFETAVGRLAIRSEEHTSELQ